MIATLVAVASLLLASWLHVAAMALAHVVVGRTPETVAFGLGPPVLERAVGRTKIRLGALPLGGFVAMPQSAEDLPDLLPPFPRAVVALVGPVSVLVVAIAFGASPAHFDRALEQIVVGALWPSQVGAPLVHAWIDRTADAPLHAAVALAVRLALFNLLPIPSLNGFDLIEGLTLAAWRRPAWRRPLVVTWIGLVLALLLSIGWIVAIALALVR